MSDAIPSYITDDRLAKMSNILDVYLNVDEYHFVNL